jgi:hypothetical protein
VAAHSGRTWVVGGRPGVLRAALAGKDPRGTRVKAMPFDEVRE